MKKIDNFYQTLENLKEIYNYDEPYDDVVLTGLVTYYSLCFEQSWKAMKEILEDEGFGDEKTGSPKKVIKTAYAARMIENEDLWMEALICRKNVDHSYNKNIAKDIVAKTKDKFYDMFCELESEIEKNWR